MLSARLSPMTLHRNPVLAARPGVKICKHATRNYRRNATQAGSPSADEEMLCGILDVRVDNKTDPKYTMLSVDVMQYPALLRTVAWTLNGLGVRVQNGYLHRDEDGLASQTYWLTDLDGSKLPDHTAYNVKESLLDFIQTCMPSTTTIQTEWQNGNVFVSNIEHDKYTVLVIKGETKKKGFLLEIATVASAIGATVHEARIQGDKDFPACCTATRDHDYEANGRVFKFLLSEEGGGKLSPGRVVTVLYTLDLIAGKGYQPTSLAGGK